MLTSNTSQKFAKWESNSSGEFFSMWISWSNTSLPLHFLAWLNIASLLTWWSAHSCSDLRLKPITVWWFLMGLMSNMVFDATTLATLIHLWAIYYHSDSGPDLVGCFKSIFLQLGIWHDTRHRSAPTALLPGRWHKPGSAAGGLMSSMQRRSIPGASEVGDGAHVGSPAMVATSSGSISSSAIRSTKWRSHKQ